MMIIIPDRVRDMRPRAERLADAFRVLERAAALGERCPENGTCGLFEGAAVQLARAGVLVAVIR